MHTSIIVHEPDGSDEEFIGLFDADGDPLFRQSERVPIGFHHFDESIDDHDDFTEEA